MKRKFKNWIEYWEMKGRTKEKDLRIVNGYDRIISSISDSSHKLLVRSIVRKLKLNKNDRVLDVGCGAGVITLPLSKFVKEIVGLDSSPSMLKRMPKKIKTILAEAKKIPFDDKTFDKILCHSVFQSFPNLRYARKVVKEIYRVCKPNGLIYIVDLPDLAKKRAYLKAKGIENHNLKRLFYKKIFFRKMFPNSKIFDNKLKGYGNAKFRFNVLIKKT